MEDLHRRLLLPRPEAGPGGLLWPPILREDMGHARRELRRLVLLWHDEAVRAGTTDLGKLESQLRKRQSRWETTPNPLLDARRPRERLREDVAELAEHVRRTAQLLLQTLPGTAAGQAGRMERS